MNADRNNKNFDELISKAIGRDKPKFDFDKWKQIYEKEINIFESQEEPPDTNSAMFKPNIQRTIFLSKIGYLAAALLVISSLTACFVLSGKVTDLKEELAQRDVAVAEADDSATINFYLKEHQDIVARHASTSPAAQQPAQMRVSRHDILYYELFDDGPEYMRPGIIVRGPSSQREIGSPEAPVISSCTHPQGFFQVIASIRSEGSRAVTPCNCCTLMASIRYRYSSNLWMDSARYRVRISENMPYIVTRVKPEGPFLRGGMMLFHIF